jgi:uncharacterized beta-barrel protein YwiB (DUF1934 family)
MNKKAVISVTSVQGGDKEPISVLTPGDFYIKDGTYYARYKETEISGMNGTITTLRIKKDELVLIRKGTTNAKMEFSKDLKNVSMYDTPYGTLQIKTDTKYIKIDVDENGGDVVVKYNMDISGQKVPMTTLEISIKVC